MISEAEIRRNAFRMKVDPMVIDLDYSLGWFLLGISKNTELRNCVRFKGGTCLRKCYFPDYRFSEDLDFTMERLLPAELLTSAFSDIAHWVSTQNGPDFQIQPVRFEIVDDEYGSESYQARIYYRGPLRWGGSPRTIRIDITRNERLSLPGIRKPISHLYSDADLFHDDNISCYCLEEMMAEKVRALGGQRRFAVSRDLYDISCLFHAGVDLVEVQNILPDKFRARGITLALTKIDSLENRKKEFQLDWDRRLSYLVQDGKGDFEQVWLDVIYVLTKVIDGSPIL